MNDKERIEKEAKEFAGSVYKRNHFPVHWDKAFRGYIAGATAEHERMTNLIEKGFIAGRSQTSWEQFKKDNDL